MLSNRSLLEKMLKPILGLVFMALLLAGCGSDHGIGRGFDKLDKIGVYDIGLSVYAGNGNHGESFQLIL